MGENQAQTKRILFSGKCSVFTLSEGESAVLNYLCSQMKSELPPLTI